MSSVPSPIDAEPLTAEGVRQSYLMILGRDPESDEIVDFQLRHHTRQATLNEALRHSEEVRVRFGQPPAPPPGYHAAHRDPRGAVEHETSPEILAAMLARIQQQWVAWGETDPHFSVISQPEFRSRELNDHALAVFRVGGAEEAADLAMFAERAGVATPRGSCIELGAGVGRITRYLADQFDHVYALDISPGNLAECDAYMAEIGVTNVTTVLIRGLEDFDSLPAVDCFYSHIVLQHNPPPVQKAMLRRLFMHIRPGGLVLFQIPSDMRNYAFDATAYLASPPPEMEMHGLPRPVVLAEMRRAGLEILDVAPDDCLGEYGSFIYFGRRPEEG